MNVFVTVGLPGSGKSTWARKKARDENTIIISRDSFRSMIKGGNYIFNKKYERFIKDAVSEMLIGGICEGFHIIVDECNITKKHRQDIIYNLRNYEKPEDELKIIAVEFARRDLNTNLYFRMLDDRELPEEEWKAVIKRMDDSFEDIDWRNEDFDGYILVDEDLNEVRIEGK